jgi:copper(I)-binding protein
MIRRSTGRCTEIFMTKCSEGLLLRGAAVGFAIVTIQFTAAVTAVTPAAAADDYDVGAIHISQPWSRATAKGATTGAGYMTITNKGSAPDKVSCVSDNASAQCEIHSMTMEGGVMKMRPVEGGLEIKPGESVMLKPGGYHVMFRELKHALEQGASVKVTLKFEHAGTVEVDYPVLALGAAAPGARAGGTMMHDSGGGMNMQGSGGGMMHMDKR